MKLLFQEKNIEMCYNTIISKLNKNINKHEKVAKVLLFVSLNLLMILFYTKNIIGIFMPTIILFIPCIYLAVSSQKYLEDLDELIANCNIYNVNMKQGSNIIKLGFKSTTIDEYNVDVSLLLAFENGQAVKFENLSFNLIRTDKIDSDSLCIMDKALLINPQGEANLEFVCKKNLNNNSNGEGEE